MSVEDFQELEAELRLWQTPPPFWWRDDDVRKDSPAFRRLLEWSKRIEASCLLGVIPGRLEPGVPDLLPGHSNLLIGQHGWMHRNYEPAGQPKSEFGEKRDPDVVLDDLRGSFQRMQELFGASFLPVFVPPWNSFGPNHIKLLKTAGFHGLSRKGRWSSIRGGVVCADVHVDVLLYGEKPPKARSPASLQAKLVKVLSKMREGNAPPETPIGVLTHHGAVHDDEGWALLADLVDITRRLGCSWLDPITLFRDGPRLAVLSEGAGRHVGTRE